ncbi:hypothetical protein [Mycobacterium sp. NAZ190054]|nr:hypothetical protein [Mycobacterium sp. NAZ190054]
MGRAAGDAAAARWLFGSFAVLAALATVASTRSGRSRPRDERSPHPTG